MRILSFHRKPKPMLKVETVEPAPPLSKEEMRRGLFIMHCPRCNEATRHRYMNEPFYFGGPVFYGGLVYRRRKTICQVCSSTNLTLSRCYGRNAGTCAALTKYAHGHGKGLGDS